MNALTTVALLVLQSAVPMADTTSFAAGAAEKLRAHLPAGRLVIQGSSDADSVRLIRSAGLSRPRTETAGCVFEVFFGEDVASDSVVVRIRVPSSWSVEATGGAADIGVDSVDAPIRATTVGGAVRVNGGRGRVEARSVEGTVLVRGARGDVVARSTNAGVRLEDIRGDVVARTVNGAVTARGIQSSSVDLSTYSGRVSYAGELAPTGHYRLSNHTGRVVLGVTDATSASVTIRTVEGRLATSVPVADSTRVEGRYRRLRLGAGEASVDLESFAGTIEIVSVDWATDRPLRDDFDTNGLSPEERP